jgi:peptidoglycan/xylan/chitin deacetylase (PgdA/CDA1 family)
VEIGSHTVTHRKLWELQWPEVEGELKGSKQMIEDETGKPVHHFSFPFAYPADKRWVSIFREKLAGCGYLSCATTKVGRYHLAQDPLSLKRLPINDLDDLQFFEAKLSGGYDWVSTLQALYKPLKARLSAKANQGLGLAGSPER